MYFQLLFGIRVRGIPEGLIKLQRTLSGEARIFVIFTVGQFGKGIRYHFGYLISANGVLYQFLCIHYPISLTVVLS